ncbi:MAG: DUF4260 domain-containing protein [Chitinophagaceae bacterium]|nr:DUF4260 domain-containing protein [Chitinophagaceae bacterium]
MKNLLRLEEGAMFIASIYLLSLHETFWWVYLILVLGPDIGMLGYLINDKAGAVSYNAFHHKGIAIAVYAMGIYIQNELIQITGVILFGHSSMDRMFGYGLKYFSGFKNTHLGMIGRRGNV